MYNLLKISAKYLGYYFSASNGKGHGIHSPFVYDFIRNTLIDRKPYPAYEQVEALRKRLLEDKTLLSIKDLGAGSALGNPKQRTIASIASNAAKPAKYGQLLFRIVKYYQPSAIVELGTSLGLTTSYLSLANPGASVITMEGAPEIAGQARQNFQALQLPGIAIKEGDFNDTLIPVLNSLNTVDFAFIDGNHRMQPTVQYFHAILEKTNNLSIVVLDDIHWSKEMEEAWQHCKAHASVTLSMDLFFIGILIFRKEIMEKQHFVIRF